MLLYETSDFSAKIDAISLWQRKKYSKSRKMICFYLSIYVYEIIYCEKFIYNNI